MPRLPLSTHTHTHSQTYTKGESRLLGVHGETAGTKRQELVRMAFSKHYQPLTTPPQRDTDRETRAFEKTSTIERERGGEGLIFHVINTIKKWSTHLIQTVAKSPFKAFQKVVSKWSCFYILYIVVSPVSNSIRLIRFEVYSLPSLKRKPHTPKKKFGCSCTSRFLKWLGVVLHFELFKLTVQIISFLQNHC